MHILLTALLALGMPKTADSLRTTDIEEVVVVSTPKETLRLRHQALASTSFAQTEMLQNGQTGIKDFSACVPNLFIPQYGSCLTTSVYIRGIGSRTGTPAVALYVDGVPQVSSAGYDFNFSNVDRVDVLRGPQSTLYGRNSMGGVIRVYTKNPMQYQGTDITFDANYTAGSSPDGRHDGGGVGHYRLNLTHYHRLSERVAFTGHFFGEYDGGYFRNEARGDALIDREGNGGARWRLIYKPRTDLHFDVSLAHEWLKQSGYPYEYQGLVSSTTTPEPGTRVGHVAYDNYSGYRRNLTNAGLTAEKTWPRVVLTSVTGFQHLHDKMDLDQDFTDNNLYTLTQRQNANTLSEEIVLKPSDRQRSAQRFADKANAYSWLVGLNAIRQWMTTRAPVTFHDDGLAWLNGLVNRQGNAHLPTVTSHDAQGNEAYTMNFVFDNQILGTDLDFPGTYKTPMTNLALFHESTLQRLFGAKGLTLTAGLRLDYEHFSLDHNAHYTFVQHYGLGGRLTYPDGSVRDGMMLVPARRFEVNDVLEGSLSKDYVQLLPRVTMQYAFSTDVQSTRSNVYVTASRGYRSGGYNIQMFSELLQARMQTAIMHNVAEATVPVVDAVTMIPADVKAKVRDMLISMGTQSDTDVQGATWYKPETSWNVEFGSHLNLFAQRLRADVAFFWMNTRDQQVSRMSAGGLGRVTANTGRSHSLGAEASLLWHVTDDLQLNAAYGFTRAKFRDGGYVPFVPRHTFAASAMQTWRLVGKWLDEVALQAAYHGAGRICWTESNNVWQNFAGKFNASLRLQRKSTELSLYARNILGTRYQTFYFETMGRGFAQYARPAEVGAQVRLRW
ncbi:MAG: TonB-dependent receptor [Bacteroidales bacterium]|nr:TonB-dependent receptor [Bacteroidales bacterium]